MIGTFRLKNVVIFIEKMQIISGKITIRFFFTLGPFSAVLPMANQGGNWTSKVSSMLQKTDHMLHKGQRLAKTKTMETLLNKSRSIC